MGGELLDLNLAQRQSAQQNLVTRTLTAHGTWWRPSATGEQLPKPSCHASTFKDKNTLCTSFYF